jgi:hypothetical protein
MLGEVIDDFFDFYPVDVLTVRDTALKSLDLSITKVNNAELFFKVYETQINFVMKNLKHKLTEKCEITSSMNFLFSDRNTEPEWIKAPEDDNIFVVKGMVFLNPEIHSNEENYGVTISFNDSNFVIPNKFNKFVIFESSSVNPYSMTSGFGDGREMSRLTLEHEMVIKTYK